MNKKHIYPILGVIGSLASIVALFLAFYGKVDSLAIKINGNDNPINANRISDVQGNVIINQSSETNVTGQFHVPTNLYGLTYHQARKELLGKGWIPNKRHWLHGDTVNMKSGNGPIFWKKGYFELDSCSGTGYAYCRFEFFDPSGRILVIITEGEEWSKGEDIHATVARVYFEN